MPSRFGATKSRNGCARCKQRRVKCSETAPCNNCIRRREDCSLLDPEATIPSSSRPGVLISDRSLKLPIRGPEAFHTPVGSADSPQTFISGSGKWAFDLHLMNHFTTRTVHTLSSYHSLIDAWQTTIIRDAALHPFLMHGILALAALYLASCCSHSNNNVKKDFSVYDYIRAFRYHQNEAMPEYRRILQNLELVGNEEFSTRSREPWPAGPIYAMSFLLGFIASSGVSEVSSLLDLPEVHEGTRTSEQSNSSQSPASQDIASCEAIFDSLVSIFVATRGSRVIVKAALEEGKLRNTAYWHLISPSTVSDYLPPPSDFLATSEWYETLKTNCLNDILGNASPGSFERDICIEALNCLQEVHKGAARSLEFKKERLWHSQSDKACLYDMSWCLKWMAIVSQDFLLSIYERHPATLVILAQFVAVCGLVEDEWYMKNWTKNAIAAIRSKLDSTSGLEWVDRIVKRWSIT